MTSNTLTRAFIGLGSNLGDRPQQIYRALSWLGEHESITVLRCTDLAETKPWGRTDQPSFVNAVAEVLTSLDAEELLAELKRAERLLGRRERTLRWAEREIDLDILLFGELVLEAENLVIPHAQLASRAFVLTQILELEPELRHPGLDVSLRELLGRIGTATGDVSVRP